MFSSPSLMLEKPVLKNKQMVGNFINLKHESLVSRKELFLWQNSYP